MNAGARKSSFRTFDADAGKLTGPQDVDTITSLHS
jgi:hypothetical protein